VSKTDNDFVKDNFFKKNFPKENCALQAWHEKEKEK
jgi:hypothetical protein